MHDNRILGLIDRLSTADLEQRPGIEAALIDIGEPVVLPLIQWLRTREPRDPKPYLSVFIGLGQSAARHLFLLLSTGSLYEIWYASQALARIGERAAIPGLLIVLNTAEDESLREQVAVALGQLGAAEAVQPLLHLLVVANPGLRMSVAAALARIGPPAVDPLVRILDDLGAGVQSRRAAAHVLADMDDERAVEALGTHLDDRLEDSDIRASAVLAFGRSGEPAVAARLLRIVEDRAEPARVRRQAISTLSPWRHDEYTCARLVSVAANRSEEPWLRGRAITALSAPASDGTVANLSDHCRDALFEHAAHIAADTAENEFLRRVSIEELPLIAPGRSIELLLALLDDPSTQIFLTSLSTLHEHGNAAALTTLRDMIADGAQRSLANVLSSYDALRCRLVIPRSPLEDARETLLTQDERITVYRRDWKHLNREPNLTVIRATGSVAVSHHAAAYPSDIKPCIVYARQGDRLHAVATLQVNPLDHT